MFDELWERYPHTQLDASGAAVGLPDGQMGNSEVGHLNLGAGAVVKQDLTKIDDAVRDGSLQQNEVLVEAFTNAERVHLLGLVSDGGVHSGWEHLRGADRAWALRSAPPRSSCTRSPTAATPRPPAAPATSRRCEGWCREAGNARVGSVVGRYFAMDRDKRWDRTQQAYDLIVEGEAPHHADTGVDAVEAGLRPRRDRRVHHPDAGRRRGAHPRPGLGHLLQLPPGPHAPARARAGRPRPSTTLNGV